jgi:integrase
MPFLPWLVPRRPTESGGSPDGITLTTFIDQYITSRMIQKPNTLKNYKATKRALLDFFGEERLLTDITPGDCDDWRADQVGKGLASATIGRTLKRARQFFRAAVRRKLISEDPMQDIKAASQVNKSREYFVTLDELGKIIAECPDAEWRLIVALARYGGMRTPSETFALTWDDVDWDRRRIRVRSPKTEGHVGRESRMVPLFPELRPFLETVFDEAPPGTVHVITQHRTGSANLRTQLHRIMERAGVAIWPRLFQNMRASRETELTKQYPLHVVTAWIGNSAPIAARHYLQVTDEDFDRAAGGGAKSGALAAQNQAQQPTGDSGISWQEKQQVLAEQGLVLSSADACYSEQAFIVPPSGVERRVPKVLCSKGLTETVAHKIALKFAQIALSRPAKSYQANSSLSAALYSSFDAGESQQSTTGKSDTDWSGSPLELRRNQS